MKTYVPGRKSQETMTFLIILQKHFSKMKTIGRRISVWEEVLKECQGLGLFADRPVSFLYRTRWPALTRTALTKWTNKKKLSAKDLLVISINQILRPKFCRDGFDTSSAEGNHEMSMNHDDFDDDAMSMDYEHEENDADVVNVLVKDLVNIICAPEDIAALNDTTTTDFSTSPKETPSQRAKTVKSQEAPSPVIAPEPDDLMNLTHSQSETSSNHRSPFSLSPQRPVSESFPFNLPDTPTPFPFINSDYSNSQEAYVTALKAYTLQCQWSTYKTMLETEVLKKHLS